jgi:uncharacterized protein YqeY
MDLHSRIESDLHAAMKRRDAAAVSSLRMVVAALKNRAIADGLGPQGRLDDAVVEAVIAGEAKKRREAAEAFEKAGRTDAAASENAEAVLYAAYLPQPLTDDELDSLIDAVIASLGATEMKQMGQVMKEVLAQTGTRADGGRVTPLVKAKLAG